MDTDDLLLTRTGSTYRSCVYCGLPVIFKEPDIKSFENIITRNYTYCHSLETSITSPPFTVVYNEGLSTRI